jgi:hypothetical protein
MISSGGKHFANRGQVRSDRPPLAADRVAGHAGQGWRAEYRGPAAGIATDLCVGEDFFDDVNAIGRIADFGVELLFVQSRQPDLRIVDELIDAKTDRHGFSAAYPQGKPSGTFSVGVRMRDGQFAVDRDPDPRPDGENLIPVPVAGPDGFFASVDPIQFAPTSLMKEAPPSLTDTGLITDRLSMIIELL